jgi:hypothetical protein
MSVPLCPWFAPGKFPRGDHSWAGSIPERISRAQEPSVANWGICGTESGVQTLVSGGQAEK